MLPCQVKQYFLLIQSAGIRTANRYRKLVESATYRDRKNPLRPTKRRSRKARKAIYEKRFRDKKRRRQFDDYRNKRPDCKKRY
ncbi:hypothetical protein [Okeania sp. SIO2B3]|uniref:hypothetical protein n=1 Tax=Okeania sp. SIO2B3 TaxID=2607784 RepID=UPI0013C160F3|nr:hypothetical protein [Okeania sp. SIO2B3]NET40596.1 hypothetical protein [Okeania sp. SIO2B3]